MNLSVPSAVLCVFASGVQSFAQRPLPPGAVAVVNEAQSGGQVALCVETGGEPVQQGARQVPATAVWAGEPSDLHEVEAGAGACDPAWSPDGQLLAVTSSEGLWVFPAGSATGTLTVESRSPQGAPTEFSYRVFSGPKWSPDGRLIALQVGNGGSSWVEVFGALSGRLFYTSPPEVYSFSWGSSARELNIGDGIHIHLPVRP
jgi:hypothetical protein